MPRGIYTRTKQNRINIGLSKKGKIPWNKGIKTGHVPWNKGKKWSEEIKIKVSKTKKSQNRKMTDEEKKKLSEYNKRIGKKPPIRFGSNNNQWKGGKSFEVYPQDWTKTLKNAIRQRDHYTCQICGVEQGDEALSVHHIDYEKLNCDTNNLVSLCRSCHRKTGDNREYWKKYFNIWILLKTHQQQKKYFH